MGPGSVLGGRYALRRRLDDAEATSSWQAHDETLDRLVHVRALAADHPHAEAVLDAARRAAAVEDARLVRVLDVGHDEGVTFVVTEWLAADSLETRLRQGPLTADSARTVVGEAALALEAARHRGLHHLRLSPRVVRVTDDGGVKVADLATAAALDGVEVGGGEGDVGSDEATSTDARDLVALAYAALTATWPLPDGSDLPAAPQVGGTPVAPAELVSGAPADLDTICAQTFSGAGGPDSPGDLARQIAPWGRQRQVERATGTFPHLLPPTPRAPLPTAPPPTPAARPAPAPGPAPAPEPLPEPDAPSEREPEPVTPAAASAAVEPDAANPLPPLAATGVLHGLGTRWDSDHDDPADDDAADDGDRLDLLGRDDDGDDRYDDGYDRYDDGYEQGYDEGYDEGYDGSGGGSDEPPSRSRTALVLVGTFVVVFLALAYCGLRGLGDNAFVPRDADAGSSSSTTATASPTATTSAPSSSTSTASGQRVEVASARGFDPQGDGGEKDDDASLAVDGKTSTAWVSDTYKSVEFGGLKKGVGLLLDLGGEHRVTSVRVRLGAGGGTVQLRTATGDTLGRALDTVRDAAGTVTLRPEEPVEAAQLVVWFTTPAAVDGGYRAEVAEVVVS